MFDAKKHKQDQKMFWDLLAPVYDNSFSALMHSGTLRMVEDAQIKPGDKVLDVACGTGNAALLAVRKTGPTGEVIGIDISPNMVAKSNEKAKARGLANVKFEEMDAEKLTYKDNSFDAIVSQWGFMLFPDSHRSLLECYRVLKPGGRLSAMVMGRAENSYFVSLAAAAAYRIAPETVAISEEGPSQFMFGPEGAFDSALKAADFAGVWSKRYVAMITVRDPDVFWNILRNGLGRFAYSVGRLSPVQQQKVIDGVKDVVAKQMTRDGLRLPVEIVIGVGHKPQKGEKEGIRRQAKPKAVEELLEAARAKIFEIAPADVEKERAAGLVILDVREPSELAEGKIPGALHVPRGTLERDVAKLVSDPRAPVLVYCEDGLRGALAAEALSNMGYRRPLNLKGGLRAWKGAGLPVAS